MEAPQSGHRLGIDQLEYALIPICPLDEPGTVLAVLQKLQQELPQICRRTLATLPLHAHLDFGLLRFLQLLQVLVLLPERQVVVVVRGVVRMQVVQLLLVLWRPLVLGMVRPSAQILSSTVQLTAVVVPLEAGQLQHVVEVVRHTGGGRRLDYALVAGRRGRGGGGG